VDNMAVASDMCEYEERIFRPTGCEYKKELENGKIDTLCRSYAITVCLLVPRGSSVGISYQVFLTARTESCKSRALQPACEDG